MSDAFETLIELFLTRSGTVFVSPQYEIGWEKEFGDGGSCPDFLALDLDREEIVVVEVTASASRQALSKKICQRETQWFGPVKRRFAKSPVIGKWDIRLLAFVRHANVSKFRETFAGNPEVAFFAIEDASFPHLYWESRLAEGLPR